MSAATPPTPRRDAGPVALLAVLGALSAFGPLTTDLYLPGLPQVADQLDVSASQVQGTLTASLVGLALGQAIAGPLSDTYGRRRPLLLGLGLFVLASLACVLAPSILVLDAMRLLQGLCGAVGIVLARAIVRDLWSGAAAARVYATLMGVVSIGPILAPLAGSALLTFTDWRGVFVALAVIGLALLAAVALGVEETLPVALRRPGGLGTTARLSRHLLADRTFLGHTLASALSFGALFAYISGSAFVYQDVYGVSPQVYGLLFGLNGVGLLVANLVNRRLLVHAEPQRLMDLGFAGMLAGTAGVVVSVLAGLGIVGLVVFLFVSVASLGFIPPNATALALADRAGEAGTASALMGVLQFTIGALAAPLAGVAGASDVPMAVMMLAFAALAVLARATLVHGPRRA